MFYETLTDDLTSIQAESERLSQKIDELSPTEEDEEDDDEQEVDLVSERAIAVQAVESLLREKQTYNEVKMLYQACKSKVNLHRNPIWDTVVGKQHTVTWIKLVYKMQRKAIELLLADNIVAYKENPVRLDIDENVHRLEALKAALQDDFLDTPENSRMNRRLFTGFNPRKRIIQRMNELREQLHPLWLKNKDRLIASRSVNHSSVRFTFSDYLAAYEKYKEMLNVHKNPTLDSFAFRPFTRRFQAFVFEQHKVAYEALVADLDLLSTADEKLKLLDMASKAEFSQIPLNSPRKAANAMTFKTIPSQPVEGYNKFNLLEAIDSLKVALSAKTTVMNRS